MELMCMLNLDGSMLLLFLSLQIVKIMSQDAYGGSFLTRLDHLSVGSPIGITVGCTFEFLTTLDKVDKWNSQRQ